MRKPIVAGEFYPADKLRLEKEMKSLLKVKKDNLIKAAIVPHAGYLFSGRCAGLVYSLLPAAETYVIIGVNHHGVGENISISSDYFETPFGTVPSDEALGEEILNELRINECEEAHLYEHSIEVQLPFLMYSQTNFKIVPIILKEHSLEMCKALAEAIVNSARRLRRRIVVIASSDFTHTGPAYNFSGSLDVDKQAIEKILALDSQGFIEIAEKTTICGPGAIATTIEAAKLLDARKAELLEYYDSSAVLNNENKVGYAGIVFRQEAVV